MGWYKDEVRRQSEIWKREVARQRQTWNQWKAKGIHPAPSKTSGGKTGSAESEAVQGADSFDTTQRYAKAGSCVPIVWGKNVWVAPPALAWRYVANGPDVTVGLALSLTEGINAEVGLLYIGADDIGVLTFPDTFQRVFDFKYEVRFERFGSWTESVGNYWSTLISEQANNTITYRTVSIKFGGSYIQTGSVSNLGTTYETIQSSSDQCISLTGRLVPGFRHQTTYDIRGINGAIESPNAVFNHGGSPYIKNDIGPTPSRRILTIDTRARTKSLLNADLGGGRSSTNYRTEDKYEIEIAETVKGSWPRVDVPISSSRSGGSPQMNPQFQTILNVEFKTSVEKGYYNKQINVQCTKGRQTRSVHTDEPVDSGNYADLVWYLLKQSSGIGRGNIDLESLRIANYFTAANGLLYNGVIAEPIGVMEFLQATAPMFMCVVTSRNGLIGLKPALPYDGSYKIKSSFQPLATFTEDEINMDTYTINYVPLSDRKKSTIIVSWTNSTSYGPEVREVNLRKEDENSLTYDASGFCTSATQARSIASYIKSRRRRITHVISFETTLDKVVNLSAGDVINVYLRNYNTEGWGLMYRDMYYQIDRITVAQTGLVRVDATHFPHAGNSSFPYSSVAIDVINRV